MCVDPRDLAVGVIVADGVCAQNFIATIVSTQLARKASLEGPDGPAAVQLQSMDKVRLA